MTISSVSSAASLNSASAVPSNQPSANSAKSSAAEDTVHLSQAAKAAVSGDADHDGDSH
jgi:hypothetical protein